MTPTYIVLLITLCACVSVFECSPISRALFHDDEMSEKRGGVPKPLRGNSFHQSLYPSKRGHNFHESLYPTLVGRGAMPPTALRKRVEDDESQKKRLANRDYFGTIIGGSMGGTGYGSFDHSSYNDHYYYEDNNSVDSYDDDYVDDYYYDEYYYDDKRQAKRVPVHQRMAPTNTRKRKDTHKTETTKQKRKPPTVVKKGSPFEQKAAKETNEKPPTTNENRFLEAIKRYLEERK